ncbi:hypothetical protein PRK78_005118 [Emydomyces testavorans]|uniref:Cytochrome P450 n=1 Tax=Emydomyces testavorans TaxID=2070801 RepID=A0AAF0IMB9_9EURO|nr:hypothetical protein PRK78_005118 [Emydomyces testavorans]
MALLADIIQVVAQHPYMVLCLLLTAAVSGLSVYRLYFHPLAKFPGPKLAAVTLWYEYYYDGIKQGQYTFEIQRMHEKYGPIVRISPHELHVNDPSFIDILYAGGGKRRDKYEYYATQFGLPESLFGTANHDHHRLRRSALNRFFSKAAVTQLEPMITKKVQDICDLIQAHAGSGEPISLSNAYSCMTSDIAAEYAFGRSTNFVSPDNPKFERNFRRPILTGSKLGVHTKQFPWIQPILNLIPISVIKYLDEGLAGLAEFQKGISTQVKDILDGVNSEKKGGRTIFHELLAGNLPPEEKTLTRLGQEGQLIVGAGTETAGWSLSVTIFYLLSQPETLAKLRRELEQAIPDPSNLPPVKTLEKLPYLMSISNSFLPGRKLIVKFTAQSSLKAYDYLMALLVVRSVSRQMHRSRTNHHKFLSDTRSLPVLQWKYIPERWLDHEGIRHRHLDPYLMSFSKGSRQCLGINLAYAELHLGLAGVVRRLGDRLELFETTSKDVEFKHDYFLPIPATSNGVRVLVQAD